MQVLIDAEFRSIIPPLAPEEFKALEESIIKEGCRDAVVVWKEKGVILDGHNRYDICTKHGIPYRTFEKLFVGRDEAILWIIDNQFSRRNISLYQRAVLALKRESTIKDIANKNLKTSTGGVHPQPLLNSTKAAIHTREELAKIAGVSTDTIWKVKQIEQKAPEDWKEKCRRGEASINEAYHEAVTRRLEQRIVHVSHNSGENEWYTPLAYIEVARKVMGSIDTDPASSDMANATVKAVTYYTKDDDGLGKPWGGNVWLNPPYAQPLVAKFSKALAAKYKSGETQQACVLVNNATETEWFQEIMELCAAICFIKGRVKFLSTNGEASGAPLQGQVVIYLGNNKEGFATEFSKMGKILYA